MPDQVRHDDFETFYEIVMIELFESRILPFIWIPTYAGMTVNHIISSRYAGHHARSAKALWQPRPDRGAGIQNLK